MYVCMHFSWWISFTMLSICKKSLHIIPRIKSLCSPWFSFRIQATYVISKRRSWKSNSLHIQSPRRVLYEQIKKDVLHSFKRNQIFSLFLLQLFTDNMFLVNVTKSKLTSINNSLPGFTSLHGIREKGIRTWEKMHE